MTSETLQQAIERVCSKDSFYWSCRETKGRERKIEQTVEIRLNVDEGQLDEMPPEGWSLYKVDGDLGAAFLRRSQPLTDDDVRRLFVDALTLADRYDGQFQSWAHGEALERIWSKDA